MAVWSKFYAAAALSGPWALGGSVRTAGECRTIAKYPDHTYRD